jgi:hypothetical protein
MRQIAVAIRLAQDKDFRLTPCAYEVFTHPLQELRDSAPDSNEYCFRVFTSSNFECKHIYSQLHVRSIPRFAPFTTNNLITRL